MKLDFFTHWMITLGVGWALALLGFGSLYMERRQRKRQKDAPTPSSR